MRKNGPAWRYGITAGISAAALLWAGTASAQTQGRDLSGTWFPDFLTNEFGPPVTGRNTPWVPLSQGDPRQMKIATAAEQNKAVTERMLIEHGKAPAPAAAAGGRGGGAGGAGGGGGGGRGNQNAALNEAGKAEQAKRKPGEGNCSAPSNVFGKIGSAMMVVQGKDRLMMSFDGYAPPRVIYLDNRTDEDAIPSWNGYSIGKWDGNTLRVKTTNLKGDSFQGTQPMSAAATLTEEYRITNNGKMMTIFATFEDPTYYKEPIRKMVYLDLKTTNNELVDSHCLEGTEDQIDTITGKPAH